MRRPLVLEGLADQAAQGGPTRPCGPASPLAPVSPFGPCGPAVGWPQPESIVDIATARIMTAVRIDSPPSWLASTTQTLNETICLLAQ